MQMEREVTKGCPQGSCCGPGFWNIQYNSLLNLEFGERTKAKAYADNLLIAVKVETVREAENYVNTEISKITKWAKDNKITFNKQKSKATVVTRKKRRENKEKKIAKFYQITSNEALCILTGTTPIEIKAEEAANLYRITRYKQNHQLGHEVEPKDWTHAADSVKINEQKEGNEHTIHIFTDGSKNEHGVGSGTAIYIQNKLKHQMKHKLHDRCSNNQAEQMAIVKALQAIETIKINKTFQEQ